MKKAILCMVLMNNIYAIGKDPFAKPAKKMLFNQRYQYLGYIQLDNKKWALIKPVSRDIERIELGKVPGLGLVKLISASKVCLEKSKHRYCLYKSSQAGVWR
jgi:hypothetical protein